MPELVVTVIGDPAPQGSKNVFRGRVVESSKRVKPWRRAVGDAVLRLPAPHVYFGSPCALDVDVTFYLPRPAKHYGTGRNAYVLRGDAPLYPARKQRDDIDKLARSTIDALAGQGLEPGCAVMDDDGQVVTLTARKRWQPPKTLPGAVIRIRALA